MATTSVNGATAGSNVQAAAAAIPVVFTVFGAAAGVFVLYRRKTAREQMEQYRKRAAKALERVRDPEQGVVAVPVVAAAAAAAATMDAAAE